MKSFLILEDGHVFIGESFGAKKDVVCEVVFNTAMTGYLEMLTDPSYVGEGVVMTYPLVGNYGINLEDCESDRAWPEALIIKELSECPSNFRSKGTLEEYLIAQGIPGIQGIDTRALTRKLRNHGVMNAVLTTDENFDLDACVAKARAYTVGDVVKKASCKEITHYPGSGHRVAVVDFGQKKSMVEALINRDCDVTVYPCFVDPEQIIASKPDGIFLSNGPGDPKECGDIIRNIKKLYDSDIPIFAICLGHQLLALAVGGDTQKMKYGHHGDNHPVRDVKTGKVYITSQNHGYVVVAEAFDPDVAEITHVNVNDGTCEGVRYLNKNVFSVQFHPEASPGPLDTASIFDDFITLMEGIKHA